MNNDNCKAVIEGLLFAAGDEGLKVAEIAEIIDLDKRNVRALLKEMMHEWKDAGRGMQIVEVAHVYQLTTLPEHQRYFEKLASSPTRSQLSRAALETLAIIAYRQPIIRVDVEEIRGVKCEKTIYYLKRKGLVKDVGRAEGVGRPILYGTTSAFLDYFGLSKLEELPPADSLFNWAELEQEREALYQRLGVEPVSEEVKTEDSMEETLAFKSLETTENR
ncbi:SMC-Scp complex subunit ScpB [Marininema halotolerans]|uniref:Segregation and condensation protein B n=1 Tax=Marininema halotolerans TaxID=1155944 RepID=A0A1I6TRV0_9BACL|nr:SMC-Scp complex subunit ScpB [Marininema halotolerans]SFS91915.1 segregation and condensation protein B [Marininema halotolerans]